MRWGASYWLSIPFLVSMMLLSSTVESYAQAVDWTADGTSWTYSSIGFSNVVQASQLYVAGDTVLDGKEAKIVLQNFEEPYRSFNFSYSSSPIGSFFIRQEGDSLLYYVDSTFQVLYDFSVSLGDTVRLYVPLALRDIDALSQSFTSFVVDSIGSISVDGQTLRGHHLTAIPPYDHFVDGAFSAGWRYELLGVVDVYLFPYGGFYCDGECPSSLRCFEGQTLAGPISLKRVDFPCDSLINSTHELDIGHLISLSPNPVGSERIVTVEIEKSIYTTELQLALYDATGRPTVPVITHAVGRVTIEIPYSLPSGVYSLVMLTPQGQAVKRLMVL